jgi:hypothetical protein
LTRLYPRQLKLGVCSIPGEFENDFIPGISGDLTREFLDLTGKRSTWYDASGQAMSVGVATGAPFSGARAGTGAFASVAPVRRDLPFGHHGSGRCSACRLPNPKEWFRVDNPV